MSAPPSPSTPITKVLWWALLAAGAMAFAVFVFAACQRVFYPHELEWMEGALADHAARVAYGQPLYCEPTAEHVPFLYAPLLFWLGGLGIRLGLDGVLALRLLATAFSFASAMLIGHWVRRETGRIVPGLVASGLFLAGYGWLAWWFDLARNDSLFVFWSIAASYQLRHGGPRRWLWAGLLATIALLAKQSALLWLPAVGIGTLVTDWRTALRFGTTAAVAMASALGALHLSSDGWSTFYLFEMPRHHGIVGPHKLGFWTRDLAPMYPLLALGLAGFAVNVREVPRPALLLAAFGSGGLMCSWFSRMHVGGFENVMMYGFAAACVLGPIAATANARWLHTVGPALLLVQFGCLGWQAWRRPIATLLPPAAHRKAHDELRAFVAAQSGPVWLPGHGYLAAREGKGGGAHGQAIFDLLQLLPPGPGGFDLGALNRTASLTELSARARLALDRFRDSCYRSIRERRYSAIVLDRPGTQAFEALFALPLAGPDLRPNSGDEPYVRRPGDLVPSPRAIEPLVGKRLGAPYALQAR